MSVKINKNLIIPAILLIVPVTLILLFDPNAWKSWYALITEIIELVFFVDVPIAMCLWHWYRPAHFRGLRLVIQAGLLTLASWAFVAALMWIGPRNGFAVASALLGWSYIWFFMIPIGAVYLIFRGALKLREAFEKWNISGTAKEWIRNILLMLIPPFFLVCAYIQGSVGWGMAGRISLLCYLFSGVVLLVYFSRKYIRWRKTAAGKEKRGLAVCFILLLYLLASGWLRTAFYVYSYVCERPIVHLRDSVFTEKSPDSRITALYFNDPELDNRCFAVRILSSDPRIESSPMFHTRA